MTINLHTVGLAIFHRKIRPFWWRFVVLPLQERMISRQLTAAFPQAASPDHLAASLRDVVERTFFFGARNRKEFFLHLLSQSQDRTSLLADGDAVLDNIFEAFGSGKVHLGESIDWQKDFISGHRWPLKRITTDEILDLSRPSDIKVPWELARFHQIWWLGKAYWISSSERYAEKFGRLVSDWISANPVGRGVHWTVAMEVAIRACNLICGFAFFAQSPSLSSAFWDRLARSLFAHGLFIWNNREVSLRNHNHYLANIVGLLFLGLLFRDTPVGRRWFRWSARTLQHEMEHQVTGDGVDYEKAIAYHRLVLELFATAAVLCKVNAIPLAPAFWSRLERMFAFTAHYTRPDGSAPLFGDADDGRLFRFQMNEPMNDHRHVLSVGAVLFDSQLFKSAAGSFSQDALFLLGSEGFERFLKIPAQAPEQSSVIFPDGGFVVFRSSDLHIIADVGDIGMNGRGGHGHNDTLSFELWAHGQSFIVDRGTYTYTANSSARQDFRSTRAHNTVMVDDLEMAEFRGLWSIQKDCTRPRVLECSLGVDHDVLLAEHSGYTRLAKPVIHRRRFTLAKRDGLYDITDELLGHGPHKLSLRFHIHPDIICSADSPRLWILRGQRASVQLQFDTEAVAEESWFSPSYGVRVPMTVLVLRQTVELPAQFNTTIRVVPSAS